MPYKDYTLKAKLINRSKIEALLLEMGASFLGLDHQTDTYFKVPKGRLKLRLGTLGSLITHYQRKAEAGAERTVVFRYDVNPAQEVIKQFLMDHDRIGLVVKERSIYVLDGVRIHLDKLPDGEEFLEIEARDLSGTISEGALKEECLGVSSLLEIDPQEIVPTGYLMPGNNIEY